jgi:uncharacterized membrane protein
MPLLATEHEVGRIWLSRRNHSLSVSGGQLLFVVAACISGVIAVAFSLFGAWPVIPFTGIELAVLWWALRRCEKNAGDFERITLEAGRLTVENGKGALVERHEFHPCWAQLQWDRLAPPGNRRLLIRSHGKEVEIGSLLIEEQKMALAKELKKALGAK